MPFSRRAPSLFATLSGAALLFFSIFPLNAWGADERPFDPDREPHERPGDPPGEPARPTPGAPPAKVWRFGSTSHVQVNVAPNGSNIFNDAANEPSIAVDPTRPNHLAIGWRQFDTITSNFRQAGIAFTTDGGRTWTNQGVLDPGVFRSDPVLSFDAQGNLYYNSLEGNFTTDQYTSTDGGESWGSPVYAFGGDKQWITVDRSGGPGDGALYQWWSNAAACCGNNIFNRSLDGAQSFEAPIPLPNLPRWGTLDVDLDGRLYLAGVQNSGSSVVTVVSSGNAYGPGVPVFDRVATADLGGPLSIFPTPNPDGLAGQVWIAVDGSDGPTQGFVYLVASTDPPGSDPLDIMFSRSEDGGLTWSSPVRINDDATSTWQWFGTMSLAPNGRIDVVWNDGRKTGSTNVYELYYSSSTDGGQTWSANEQISGEWNSHFGWPNQNKIGDYYHMISDQVGAHLAWAATFNGEQDVYYTRIGDYDCNDNGVPDTADISFGQSDDDNGNEIPDECEGAVTAAGEPLAQFELLANVPNPFSASTALGFTVSGRGGNVTLRIYDVSGREVRRLYQGYVAAGTRTLVWEGLDSAGNRVPQGIYYAELETPEGSQTRRMLLLD